jgi:hypothetical protein
MYALAATGVGMLVSPPGADGKVVYTLAHDKVQFGVVRPIDLNHDGIADFILLTGGRYSREWLELCDHSLVLTYSKRQEVCKSTTNFPNAAIRTFSTYAGKKREYPALLRKGAQIGKGQQFGSMGSAQIVAEHLTFSSRFWYGPWLDNGKGTKTGYLGVRFKILNELHYGWVRLCIKTHIEQSGNTFTATLDGYAYETVPNKSIIAGETKGADDFIPESGSLGALAAGAPAKSALRAKQTVTTSH